MNSVPSDIDREQFVLDVDWRNTAHLATSRVGDGVFEIAPRSLVPAQLVAMNLVYVACGLICAFVILPRWHMTSTWALAFVTFATVIACGATTGITDWSHVRELQMGAWFIYDSNHDTIKLPRQRIEFARSEVVQIEEVTTRSPKQPTCHLISELNVVVIDGSGRRRWNLLRSDAADGAFSHLLIPLRRCVDLPIVRIRGNAMDWTVCRLQLPPIATH
ncbi:MAG: hypothetical protein KDB23_13115 [Planctomycetales bacterium]|nr:hypothetical protein [Planctomycetales bacterium]